MVALTVAVITSPGTKIRIEALVAETHCVIERIAARHRTTPGFGAALPIVHIVLLERARRAEYAHARQTEGFLDVRRSSLVHVDPGPDLGLVGSAWVPYAKGSRGRTQHRKVREDG